MEAGAWSPVHLVARMRVVERGGKGVGGRACWEVESAGLLMERTDAWEGSQRVGTKGGDSSKVCPSSLPVLPSWRREAPGQERQLLPCSCSDSLLQRGLA